MNLSPILARLKARLSGFRSFGALADLAAAEQAPLVTPACFIAPASERPSEPLDLEDSEQLVDVHFSVILALPNRRDPTGAQALADLQAARDQVKAALHGWAVDPATYDGMVFRGGALLKFDDGVLWWGDDFSTLTVY